MCKTLSRGAGPAGGQGSQDVRASRSPCAHLRSARRGAEACCAPDPRRHRRGPGRRQYRRGAGHGGAHALGPWAGARTLPGALRGGRAGGRILRRGRRRGGRPLGARDPLPAPEALDRARRPARAPRAPHPARRRARAGPGGRRARHARAAARQHRLRRADGEGRHAPGQSAAGRADGAPASGAGPAGGRADPRGRAAREPPGRAGPRRPRRAARRRRPGSGGQRARQGRGAGGRAAGPCGGDPRRRGDARAPARQPGRQRRARHSARRRGRGQRVARQSPPRATVRAGQRYGHRRRRAGQAGGGAGRRARAAHLPGHRREARGRLLGREHAGAGQPLPGRAAALVPAEPAPGVGGVQRREVGPRGGALAARGLRRPERHRRRREAERAADGPGAGREPQGTVPKPGGAAQRGQGRPGAGHRAAQRAGGGAPRAHPGAPHGLISGPGRWSALRFSLAAHWQEARYTRGMKLRLALVAQLAVCTVPDLGDWSKEDFAADLFRKWDLGHGKKRADGLLVLIVPGKPGHRKIKVEVGYGLEGILPDGKATAMIDQYAVPALKRDDYGDAAVKLVDAYARVLEANAAPGGELAPTADSMRGGRGVGAARAPTREGGLGVAILCMGAVLFALVSSGMRRKFPGKKTVLTSALLTAVAVVALVALGGGAGWIALLVGLVVNGFAYASIRSHKCPRDGSWMAIDQQIVDEPTYWSRGLAHVVERCTNPRCGYKREYDKELPRKQRTVYVGGGGGGGWGGGGGGGGGGDGFSGGGGGDSGGGGGGREV